MPCMRRLFTIALALGALGLFGACDHSPTGPQLTVDGDWSGLVPGYALSMTLTQTDTVVTGGATLAGFGGNVPLTAVGTIVARHMVLTLTNDLFTPMTYEGDLSTTKAEILNSSHVSESRMP